MKAFEKFETAGLAPADRLPYWNDLVDRVYAGTWVNCAHADFRAEMWRWKVGDLNMIRPRSDASQVGRAADLGASEENIVLHLQRRGISTQKQCGREARLAAGDFALLSAHHSYLVDLSDHELLVVQFPRRLIAEKVRHLDDRLGTCISGETAGGRIFHDFLLSLWRQGDQSHADPDWQAGVTNVFADLVSLAINLSPDGSAVVAGSALRERALAVVEARLGDPDLSTATLAVELKTTPRTVQHLFATMGTTPIGYISERRLDQAAALLAGNSGMSITDVAFDLGFNDSSYFSRQFRRRFGVTATAYRRRG